MAADKISEIKESIKSAIQSFAKGKLTEKSLELFEELGYVTSRRAPLYKPTYAEFKDSYIGDRKFDETKAKTSEWKYVDLLFQLSKEEVLKQMSLFDTKQVNRTIIETYLFFVIELNREAYSRTELSLITREVNRLFPMPAMILFKHGKTLTLSVINRRLHKKDESKDVLEKVTQIKEINIESPHRAHIEILFDLSFDELKGKHQFTNFVELHNAWQKTLDTKELNKRFYSELFNWYLWAVRSVNFPNDINDDKDDKVYNSESVIRLLTRLIFVWFIKEKNLVPIALFEHKKLNDILKGFQPHSMDSSVYYRAILQNLFFATLNTPMDKDITAENKDEQRRFINTLPKTGNDQYLDQTKYRYQNYFTTPDKALELFATIPFLNGGLFECLDFIEINKETGRPKEMRYDGFSSTEKRQAFVPDKLFFAEEFMLDLNAEYGTKGKKYQVEGLINILDSYKFTITENTPLEEEIALDPELLGKVFENLLASYNPETQTTARKQTGSFYTPREIVNYMVDESLIAYFKNCLNQDLQNIEINRIKEITEESEQLHETKLRQLFAFHSNENPFDAKGTTLLIKAISEVKILDPACGSGAFPMGVLHRLVDLLNKLDPNNEKWNDLQIKRAIAETAEVFVSGSLNEEREIRLNEINKAFDLNMNHPDYARKLFLIENCIYGVDIQQIAIQISKLRFFISLIVDQKVNDAKPNRNILSMPNLETKFVAANTLIGLDKPQQMTLMAGDVERFEKELASIRHKIFFTRKYSAKKVLKKQEKAKREELQKALENSGYTKNVAGQMAGWNPFDPMQSAKFFDPETMFGLTKQKNDGIGFTQSREITLINKQIEAINKQVEALNFSLKLDQAHAIIKLQLVSTQLQVNIIEAELGNIQKNIEVLFGTIQPNVSSIVNEPIDVTYTINALNKSIALLNVNIKEIGKDIKPVSKTNDEGVFDIVIGNPPYGANLLIEQMTYLKSNYKLKSTETAILFIEKGFNILKSKGFQSFIIPKSFTFASNYEQTRDFVVNDLRYLVDCGKAFENVKLEACVFGLKKKSESKFYKSLKLNIDLVVEHKSIIDKSLKTKFDFLPNGLTENEINLGIKILDKCILLAAISKNSRGEILQSKLETKGKFQIIGGKEINKYGIRGIKGYINDASLITDKSKIHSNSILAQNIVAHLTQPYEHLKIIACIPDRKSYMIVDTINQITILDKNFTPNYIWCLLNSRLVNWYCYLFILAKAIRTIHFDNSFTSRIPVPELSLIDQQPFIILVDQILSAKAANPKADTSQLEKQIDEMVYKLYELTEEEIAIIEGKNV